MVNSVAVQMEWLLWALDISAAFLKGLSFKEIAEYGEGEIRNVQFEVPKNCVALLRKIPGYENFDPATEVLNIIKPLWGLKDAPRLFTFKLAAVLAEEQHFPTQADSKLYLRMHGGKLVSIVGSQVDDV